MDIHTDITTKAEELRVALYEKMGVRGKTFSRAVVKAGRLLPRRIRNCAAVIVKAQDIGSHPKFLARIDTKAVKQAHAEIKAYLAEIDPQERQRTRFLRWLGGAAFNLIVVGVFLVIWLVWSGKL